MWWYLGFVRSCDVRLHVATGSRAADPHGPSLGSALGLCFCTVLGCVDAGCVALCAVLPSPGCGIIGAVRASGAVAG